MRAAFINQLSINFLPNHRRETNEYERKRKHSGNMIETNDNGRGWKFQSQLSSFRHFRQGDRDGGSVELEQPNLRKLLETIESRLNWKNGSTFSYLYLEKPFGPFFTHPRIMGYNWDKTHFCKWPIKGIHLFTMPDTNTPNYTITVEHRCFPNARVY